LTVLIISNEWDIPTDSVVGELNQMNVKVFRLNTEYLCERFDFDIQINQNGLNGGFSSITRDICLSDIKSIYFRRPKYPMLNNLDERSKDFVVSEMKAFLRWLWLALSDKFWVSKVPAIRQAESKIDQLRVVPKLGFNIPKTLISNSPEKARKFYDVCEGKIINKVLRNGYVQIDGVGFNVYTNRITKKDIENFQAISMLPCVFQERIEKKYELRITVVGNRVFATEIHSQHNEKTKDDWRKYDLDNTPHKIHNLPKDIEKKCLSLLRYYDLSYGAIDMIVTPDDKYVFLEINPNGQWLWLEYLTGEPMSKSIAKILADGGF